MQWRILSKAPRGRWVGGGSDGRSRPRPAHAAPRLLERPRPTLSASRPAPWSAPLWTAQPARVSSLATLCSAGSRRAGSVRRPGEAVESPSTPSRSPIARVENKVPLSSSTRASQSAPQVAIWAALWRWGGRILFKGLRRTGKENLTF